MFRFRQLVCVVLGVALVIAVCFAVDRTSWQSDNANNAAMHRSDSTRQTAAALNQEWSSFQIPADSVAIRVLANAAVKPTFTSNVPNRSENEEASIGYAIEFELLDKDSSVLHRGTYHFRSRLRQRVDTETQDHYYPMHLADSDSVVAQTRSMHLPLDAELQSARLLRLRKSTCDEDVTEVLTRPVCRSSRGGHEKFGAWDAVSDSRKRDLARHSVYDHQMLDQDSRESLLKWHWARAIPIGQYDRRRLYSIGSVDDSEVAQKRLPSGTIVDAARKIVIPLGDSPVTLRVEATALDRDAPVSGTLKWTWVDSETGTNQQDSRPFNGPVEIENVSGLIQLETECSAALNFWTRDADSKERWAEFEFEPKRTLTYLADQRPVGFAISHFGGKTTPLKITLRSVEERSMDRSINWRFIDGDGNVVKQDSRQLQTVVSAHERIGESDDPVAVSDPINLWFPIEPEIKKVEFWSNESQFLINAYARSDELQVTTRVPEDYQADSDESPRRRWFTLKPEHDQQYVEQDRRIALQVQTRLAEPDVDANEKENLVWKRYLPDGDWIATRLLVPVLDPMESQTETKFDSQWLWNELESNRPTDFQLLNRTSQYREVKVAFVSDRPAGTIRLHCDGEIVAERSFTSSRGEFSAKLPRSSGKLVAQFDPEVRLFVSGISGDLPASKSYYRRSAIRIDGATTHFDYEKKTHEEEHITLTLFRNEDESNRAAIAVRIVAHQSADGTLKPQDGYTIRERSFDIQAQTDARSILLDRRGSLDQGSRCFIALGSDLPLGKYSIEIEREDSTRGLLLLYQMAPKTEQVRRVHIHDNSQSQIASE